MSSYDELKRMYPALDAHERGDYAALRASHPLVDQSQAAMDHGGDLSPAARFHPIISEGIDRAQQVALSPNAAGSSLPRILANIGREPLPHNPQGYKEEGLRALEQIHVGADEQERLDYKYELMTDIQERSGQPGCMVALHCKGWTYDSDYPAPRSPAWPLSRMWTPKRAARRVAQGCWDCWFCDGAVNRNPEYYLLVSCGAVVHMFATCPTCKADFDRDTEPGGLDWVNSADRSWGQAGFPDDRYL